MTHATVQGHCRAANFILSLRNFFFPAISFTAHPSLKTKEFHAHINHKFKIQAMYV